MLNWRPAELDPYTEFGVRRLAAAFAVAAPREVPCFCTVPSSFRYHLRHEQIMRTLPRLLFLCICILFAVTPLLSQNATAPTSSAAQDPKPRDPSAGWKGFVGVYEYSDNGNYKQTVAILMTNLGWRLG